MMYAVFIFEIHYSISLEAIYKKQVNVRDLIAAPT